jgi:hypothetical protein
MNLWPPFLGAGIRVRSIAADWSEATVELRERWRLAHHPRLRSIIDEEIDLAWQGKKGSAEALNAAVRRGNALLGRGK